MNLPIIGRAGTAACGRVRPSFHVTKLAKDFEVIINCGAGGGPDTEAGRAVEEAFASCGASARVHLAREGEELTELARAAVSNGARAVVAGGGDGTVGAVASALVGTGKTLGVLPLGTLNHFAKDLRIPLEVEGAARNVCEGREVFVDVAEVEGGGGERRLFINNSGLGLYPHIVRRREKLQERESVGKWTAFARASLAILRRYPFLHVRLNADGKEIVRRTPFVFIGNNEYEVEGARMGGRERLDAGRLSLYVAHRTGRLGLLRLALRALLGRLRQTKDFDALSAEEIWIETHRPKRLYVATDGEVTVMTTPLHYRVLPKALRVIVPK